VTSSNPHPPAPGTINSPFWHPRGGYAINTNVYRVTAGTVGGPLLLIEGNYDGQTGDFPPDLTDINLFDRTVDDCEGI
jgi:hypothetical protein